MSINKEQIKALGIYLLEQTIYPEDVTYSLRKTNRSGIFSKIEIPLRTDYFNINNFLNFEELNSIVEFFHTTLIKELPHCSPLAFYKNIQSLKIKQGSKSKLEKLREKRTGEIIGADYDSRTNKIRHYPEEYDALEGRANLYRRASITHELLHMATRYKKGLIRISGFEQAIGDYYRIGYGLNEGYTEYLNCKYFCPIYPSAYSDLQMLSKGIEMIVGKETMESLYFDGDLKSLVNNLGTICGNTRAIQIIQEIDDCATEKDSYKRKNHIQKLKVELANIYLLYKKRQLDENRINKSSYDDAAVRSLLYIQDYQIENSENAYIISKNNLPDPVIIDQGPYDVLKKALLSDRSVPYNVSQDDISLAVDPFVLISTITEKNVSQSPPTNSK